MAVTKAHIRASAKYDKKAYDKIQISLRKDSALNANAIREHAAKKGESVNSFLLRAIGETITIDTLKRT